jgi:hypothetical protein
MATFNLANSFAAYNEKHLLKLADFYPMNFSTDDLHKLSFEPKLYIHEIHTNSLDFTEDT